MTTDTIKAEVVKTFEYKPAYAELDIDTSDLPQILNGVDVKVTFGQSKADETWAIHLDDNGNIMDDYTKVDGYPLWAREYQGLSKVESVVNKAVKVWVDQN